MKESFTPALQRGRPIWADVQPGVGSDIPLVTILIPTYNRSQYLPTALRSAVSQTYLNVEVLVLDDASPDAGLTAAAVQFFLIDPRVRFIRQSVNVGIAGNWRAGIAAAAGEFFCLLHDDDTIEPTFVAELTAVMTNSPDVVVAFSDHWVTDPNGQRLPEISDRTSRAFGRSRLPGGPVDDFARAALVDTSIPVGASLFRRADVPPEFINDDARGSIDMWLLYRCVTTGNRAVYVPRRLMNYRSHAGGMSSGQPLYMTEGHLWRYDRMLSDDSVSAIHADLRAARVRTQVDYGVHLLAAGRRRESMIALTDAAGRKAAIGRILARLGPLGTILVRMIRRF